MSKSHLTLSIDTDVINQWRVFKKKENMSHIINNFLKSMIDFKQDNREYNELKEELESIEKKILELQEKKINTFIALEQLEKEIVSEQKVEEEINH